jgi:hypothetical protein
MALAVKNILNTRAYFYTTSENQTRLAFEWSILAGTDHPSSGPFLAAILKAKKWYGF